MKYLKRFIESTESKLPIDKKSTIEDCLDDISDMYEIKISDRGRGHFHIEIDFSYNLDIDSIDKIDEYSNILSKIKTFLKRLALKMNFQFKINNSFSYKSNIIINIFSEHHDIFEIKTDDEFGRDLIFYSMNFIEKINSLIQYEVDDPSFEIIENRIIEITYNYQSSMNDIANALEEAMSSIMMDKSIKGYGIEYTSEMVESAEGEEDMKILIHIPMGSGNNEFEDLSIVD